MNDLKILIDELQNITFNNKHLLDSDSYKKILEKLGEINQNITRKIAVKRISLKVPCIYNWGIINEDDPLYLGFTDRVLLFSREEYDSLSKVISDSHIDNKTEFEDLKSGDYLYLSGSEIPKLQDSGSDDVTLKYTHHDEDYFLGNIQCLITKIENIGYIL